MFSLSIHKCFIKYSILIILLECMAQTQAVERWVKEDHFNSGRKLMEYVDDTSDIVIFFVVLVTGVLITFPLVRYMCKNGYCGDDIPTDPDISAIVHPPPRQLVQQPQMHVGFANTGYGNAQIVLSPTAPLPQSGIVLDDRPPDYATVVQGNLSQGAHQMPYPRVMTRDETR